MSDVYGYAVLPEDPTTQVWICWIDNSGDGGEAQSVEINTDDYEDSDPVEIPESEKAYRYSVKIDNLSTNSVYDVTINSSDEITTGIKTLPQDLPKDGLNVGVTSDHHPWRSGGMIDIAGGPKPMENMAQDENDLIIYAGDFINGNRNPDPDITDKWMDYINDYMGAWMEGRLVPVFAVPGNHDIGYGAGYAPDSDDEYVQDEPDDPDRGYFQTIFPNSKELGPTDENFGEVTIGDYLQVVGLDNHSAHPDDQADWLKDAIDESVDLCIPFYHVAMFPGKYREYSSPDVQRYLHSSWFPLFYEAENVHFTICGNEHCRKLTRPMVISESEPAGDCFKLDDGRYLTADDRFPRGNVVEIGDGWMANRSGTPEIGDWFLERAETGTNQQYYSLEISNPTVQITEYDEDGDEIDSFELPNDEIAGFRSGSTWQVRSGSTWEIGPS